ncbi:TonB-dependent receptor [Portibacter marinus]|uniref:TonB-dependent receptor n=1 Tax=Portibacter marinus TaxID=2898660 RepID=UPI001F281FE4|nr:TonB-dependent receptor plug domain-containing protein [Portibacter marinus]
MRKSILFVILSVISLNVISQDITGSIYSVSGEPIVEAYIFTSEKNIHSHSDISGNFILKGAEVGDTVHFSYLGFATAKHIVTDEDFEREVEIKMKPKYFELDQVYISNSVKTPYQVANIDLSVDPVSSSQEILRKVPGLFIGQHAGGGKAEQIFLRGFDIDHGTDITLSVDGMPVNMVSHAHGQGYADLHFVIPETIDQIDFGKGPYYADQGNFNTAGYVAFKTKDKIDESKVGVEYGQFNTSRFFGLFDILGSEKNKNAYVASEYLLSDGPFESPQNFSRLNVMAKYNQTFNSGNRLSLLFSRFQSKWDASGQIPQRLVENGTISRFGAVDDTEGGNTARTNVLLDYTKIIGMNSFVKTKSYYVKYDFELFSNFTFFLEDPVNGDQIRQHEDREIYGLESSLFQTIDNSFGDIELNFGVGVRHDDIDDNELSWTINRKTLRERVAFGDVNETNFYSFANAEFDFGPFMINPGLRFDYFNSHYVDRLSTAYSSEKASNAIVSPKLNVIYNPGPTLQLYLKSGIGFHSNDTRAVVVKDGLEILPPAYGIDLGTTWKPIKRLWINTALWYLFLEQEFVYVGDAGIVEPSGRTNRRGIEFGMRYQIVDEVFFNSDITYTHARSVEAEGENYIPLAPSFTATGGLNYKSFNGLQGGLQYRYISDRPANEDFSITALGYLVMDLNMSYRIGQVTLGFNIENLFNTEWNEAQFATESRLRNESVPVEELHFTPGAPFFFRANVAYSF